MLSSVLFLVVLLFRKYFLRVNHILPDSYVYLCAVSVQQLYFSIGWVFYCSIIWYVAICTKLICSDFNFINVATLQGIGQKMFNL